MSIGLSLLSLFALSFESFQKTEAHSLIFLIRYPSRSDIDLNQSADISLLCMPLPSAPGSVRFPPPAFYGLPFTLDCRPHLLKKRSAFKKSAPLPRRGTFLKILNCGLEDVPPPISPASL
jgi:hypothetical protein